MLVKSPAVTDEELARAAAAQPELANELALLHRQWRRFDSSRARLVSAVSDAPIGFASLVAAGKLIDRFECRRLLGRGGMGEVWEAEEVDLKRRVALKLLPRGTQSSPEDVARFRREAEATSRVRHPGIVSVHSAGESEGSLYIAYELVEGGRSLRNWIDERARAEELPDRHYAETAQLFLAIAEALEAAHAIGIVHRDLKPQNVLMSADGRPKVADFGLAKVSGELSLSRTGSFLGTWLYASPEQVRGESEIDARSDVFSLGVTLYECLTLRRPFEGDTRQQVVARILHEDPVDPRKLRSKCPSDLAVICSKMLEKSRERRYASMAELADDLQRHLSDRPILAREPSILDRARKWTLRHPTLAATIAISSAAFVIVVSLLFQTDAARIAAETARANERRTNDSLRDSNAALDLSRRDALASATRANDEATRARRASAVRAEVIAFMAGMFDAANPESIVDQEPKAHELVDRAAAELDAGALLDPEVRAPMLFTVAKLYDKLGRYDDAQRLAIESIATFGDADRAPEGDADYARLLLGGEFGRHADFQAAYEMIDPLLARAESDPNTSCNWLADLRYSRGQLHLSAARFAEAEADMLALIDVGGEATDRDELTRAVDQIDLGGVYIAENRLDAADPCIARGLETLRRRLGDTNIRTINALNSLALIRRYRGNSKGAAELFEQCVESASKLFRPDHPDFLTLQMNLAQVWTDLGRFDDAEALFRELVEVSAKSLGESDPNSLMFLAGLGGFLNHAGKFADAEEVNRRVYSGRLKVFGPDHHATLESENNLAFDLIKLGRFADAVELQEEVVRRTPKDDAQYPGRARQLGDAIAGAKSVSQK